MENTITSQYVVMVIRIVKNECGIEHEREEKGKRR
jgi:hypothetical protein